MGAAEKWELVSVDDYLSGELISEIKHEYINGTVVAMAGPRARHNTVAGNCFGLLFLHLRGHPCQPFNSDMKVRVKSDRDLRFYYPDISVSCSPVADEATFYDDPTIVIEVTSPSTRRLDKGEKKVAYLSLDSLAAYLIIDPSRPYIEVFRKDREGNVTGRIFSDLDDVVDLPEIGTDLKLAEIYERIDFEGM